MDGGHNLWEGCGEHHKTDVFMAVVTLKSPESIEIYCACCPWSTRRI